eukprot:SAG22_NODE_2543_length_2462_cov_2.798561_2_plen_76_part_00
MYESYSPGFSSLACIQLYAYNCFAMAPPTDSLVQTSGRPADDDVLAGVDDALAAALGALDAGLANDGGAAGAAEA